MKAFRTALQLVLLSVFSISSSAQDRWGVVNFSASFLRAAPDYEVPLETQALMGSIVEIMGSKGYWLDVQLQNPSYRAWTTDMGVAEMTREELDAYIAAPKYFCLAILSRIYAKPSANSEILSEFIAGDVVRKSLDVNGKPLVYRGFSGVVLPDGRVGYVRSNEVQDYATRKASQHPTGLDITRTAMKLLGVPYMWGGNSSKNVDCSGLVWLSYYINGIDLPRNASQQALCGTEVVVIPPSDAMALDDDALSGSDPASLSSAAIYDNLHPGDLLFFGKPATSSSRERITHVGIYIGEGRFIHASQVVRISSLLPTSPDLYPRSPLKIRRLL